MDKPTKHTDSAFDYHECRDYLQTRDGYNERDYAGKYTGHPQAPYQDFWHFVIDRSDCVNGSTFTMEEDWADDALPWQREILMKYLDTFGDTTPGEPGRFIQFSVWW